MGCEILTKIPLSRIHYFVVFNETFYHEGMMLRGVNAPSKLKFHWGGVGGHYETNTNLQGHSRPEYYLNKNIRFHTGFSCIRMVTRFGIAEGPRRA